MRRYFTGFIFLTALFSPVLPGCGAPTYKMSTPYKAAVVAFTGVDNDGKAQFAIAERTFRTLTDFNNLDGTYANIRRGGTLAVKDINGSLVASENFEGGSSPKLRYRVQDGTALALDYSTLAMLSAYWQIDEIYSTLESVTGVKPTDLQANLPGGKHTILFEPEIKFTGKGSEVTAGVKLNAAFSPLDKKFLLFQRSPVENIPLAANFQVMTHEFGHFLFDYSFFGGKTDADNRWAEEWALSGLNEGFADLISWIFTDSPDILGSSINIDSVSRERNFATSNFTYSDLASSSQASCSGEFYCVGTLFARSLYQTQKALSATVTKKDLAAGVIASLLKTQEGLNKLSDFIMPIKADRDSLTYADAYTRDGQIIGGFLRVFIQNAPTTWKTELCNAFRGNFGASGFPDSARTGVCD